MSETNCDLITKEFLEAKVGGPIESFRVSAGSNHGDNYTSVLYAIELKVKGEATSRHWLLKTFPEHPARQKFLEDANLFLKEFLVYKALIPELLSIQGPNKTLSLALPPFIDGQAVDHSENGIHSGDLLPSKVKSGGEEGDEDDPIFNNYILMVDMRKPFGFKMADRLQGLDLAHCSLVIKEMAKLHAFNWAYLTKNRLKSLKDKFPFVEEVLFKPSQRPVVELMVNKHFTIIMDLLEEALGEDCEMVKGYARFFEDPFDLAQKYTGDDTFINEEDVTKLLRVKPPGPPGPTGSQVPWKVGNHGDCWLNNMLFRYDELTGTPVETVLVDLQLYREACPTVELSYFFYTSTSHELRATHLEGLLDLYSTSFLGYCSDMGVSPLPGFSHAELRRRFHLAKPFGIIIGAFILPIILKDPESAIDLDHVRKRSSVAAIENLGQLMEGMGWSKKENERLAHRFIGMVKEMYEDGVI